MASPLASLLIILVARSGGGERMVQTSEFALPMPESVHIFERIWLRKRNILDF